jgi:hypothetical protein
LSGILTRLAAGAPAPVFAVAGLGTREAVQDLRLHPGVRLLDSPRAANVLLVAGNVPEELWEPLARVHDAMSYPRCTVFWALGESRVSPPALLRDALEVQGDAATAIVAAHYELLTGRRPSDPPLQPDEDAAPWRGVGPYGQGGSGMTGGTPYGRPMAEVAADRDGLRLDLLPLRVGPFFPRFPPGLQLDLKLAGDIVVELSTGPNPYASQSVELSHLRPSLSPFVRALTEPVPIAELELARARAHLRWLADALIAHELPALGIRVLRLAAHLQPGDGPSVRSLARALSLTQVLGWSTRGVGVLSDERLTGLGLGPVARAVGVAEDVRLDDPGYLALGFEPILQQKGDASARWRQRLAEASQSLELAARANGLRTEPVGRVESPRGRLERGSGPAARLLPLLPQLLQDLEWGDAVTTLVSLDLDLEEAGVAEQLAVRQLVS